MSEDAELLRVEAQRRKLDNIQGYVHPVQNGTKFSPYKTYRENTTDENPYATVVEKEVYGRDSGSKSVVSENKVIMPNNCPLCKLSVFTRCY